MKTRVCLKYFVNGCRDFDTSNLSAKTDFIALKAEVDMLDINNLVNILTGLSI